MRLLSEVNPTYQKMYGEAVSRGTIVEAFDKHNLPKSFRVRCAIPSNQQTSQCSDLANRESSQFVFIAGWAVGHASLGHPVVIEGNSSPIVSSAI